MKKLLLLVPLFALAACDHAVADAIKHVESYADNELKGGTAITTSPATVSNFTELAAVGPDNVIFKTGDTFSVSASGDAKALEHLVYVLKDGVLKVGRDEYDHDSRNDKATITVTAPSLAVLTLAGSGNMTADKLSGTDVKLDMAGSGDMKVALVEATSLKGNLAGSGDIELAGKATNADYSIAGSGSIVADKLVTIDVKVSIAGSGDANLNATGNVKTSVVGSGDVTVTGGGKCSTTSIGTGKTHCG